MSDTYDIVQQAMDRLSAGDTVDTVGLAFGNEPHATLPPIRLEPGDMIAGITNHGTEPLLLYPLAFPPGVGLDTVDGKSRQWRWDCEAGQWIDETSKAEPLGPHLTALRGLP